MARAKHNSIVRAEPVKRQAILDALTRATAIKSPSSLPSREIEGEIGGYYTLTLEEMTALVNGDVEKIEGWVSTLDQHHATWLLRWLIRER